VVNFASGKAGVVATSINDTRGKFTLLANYGNNSRLLTPLSELEEKIYLYVNSTTQRCSNKIIETFWIEDFFHSPPMSKTPVVHLELQISPKIKKKLKTPLKGYSGAWGN
jgi:hypothetical protein